MIAVTENSYKSYLDLKEPFVEATSKFNSNIAVVDPIWDLKAMVQLVILSISDTHIKLADSLALRFPKTSSHRREMAGLFTLITFLASTIFLGLIPTLGLLSAKLVYDYGRIDSAALRSKNKAMKAEEIQDVYLRKINQRLSKKEISAPPLNTLVVTGAKQLNEEILQAINSALLLCKIFPQNAEYVVRAKEAANRAVLIGNTTKIQLDKIFIKKGWFR